MIYQFYTRWGSTANNHAGFAYLCESLEKRHPKDFKTVNLGYIPYKTRYPKELIPRIVNKIKRILNEYNKVRYARKWAKSQNFSNNDILLMTEYMIKGSENQMTIIDAIRPYFRGRIFGISHLCNKSLDDQFSNPEIKVWIDKIDGLITLGSSLTSYYINRGVNQDKLITTVHYVDDYYRRDKQDIIASHVENSEKQLQVLVQGSMMRDYDTLDYIVSHCPDIHFYIFQGFDNFSNRYYHSNVTLIPYVEESALRQIMEKCDVSLNCMYDTIGSNVITTSLAMGLAMICSDVGSIHDYCDDSNSFFCKNPEHFVDALNRISIDRNLLLSMKLKAREKADNFTISRYVNDLKTFF